MWLHIGFGRLTFCRPSFMKEIVNIPLSTHICMSSAGSPPTLANSMPCYILVSGETSQEIASLLTLHPLWYTVCHWKHLTGDRGKLDTCDKWLANNWNRWASTAHQNARFVNSSSLLGFWAVLLRRWAPFATAYLNAIPRIFHATWGTEELVKYIWASYMRCVSVVGQH